MTILITLIVSLLEWLWDKAPIRMDLFNKVLQGIAWLSWPTYLQFALPSLSLGSIAPEIWRAQDKAWHSSIQKPTNDVDSKRMWNKRIIGIQTDRTEHVMHMSTIQFSRTHVLTVLLEFWTLSCCDLGQHWVTDLHYNLLAAFPHWH